MQNFIYSIIILITSFISVANSQDSTEAPIYLFAGLKLESGYYGLSDFTKYNGTAAVISASGEDFRYSFELAVGTISIIDLKNQFDKDLLEFRFGLTQKKFFFPIPVFVLLGVNYNMLMWNYQNAQVKIEYDENESLIVDDNIYSDGLNGISLDLGTGIDLINFKYAIISLEIFAGGTFYNFFTNEDLYNEFFRGNFYAKSAIEIMFRMGK